MPKKQYLKVDLAGVNQDLPPEEIGDKTWSYCSNVNFKNGATQKCKGYAPIFGTTGTTPTYLVPVTYPSNHYWVYPGLDKVYVTDMITHFNITPDSITATDLDQNWNGGVLNQLVVLNNGQDAPFWWNGSPGSVMTALTAFPANTTCSVLRPFKNYLVALDITDATGDFPNLVKWSDAAAPGAIPGSWDITDPTVDAGETTLADSGGKLLDLVPFGDGACIYGTDSCYLVQYIGGQSIFKFRKLFEFGTLATDCIVTLDNQQIVLTDGDVVIHNGQTSKSILSRRMRDWLFNQIDADYYQRSYLATKYEDNEIWICFPKTGSTLADTALIWEYENDLFTVRDIPPSRYGKSGIAIGIFATSYDAQTATYDTIDRSYDAAAYSSAEDSLLFADEKPAIQEMDTGETADGTNFTAIAERTAFPIIDLDTVKLISGIWPHISNMVTGATMIFRVGVQMTPASAVDWSGEMTYTHGTTTKMNMLKKGRYVCLQAKSTGSESWQLNSIDIEIQPGAKW